MTPACCAHSACTLKHAQCATAEEEVLRLRCSPCPRPVACRAPGRSRCRPLPGAPAPRRRRRRGGADRSGPRRAAAAGFGRLLSDPQYRVVLAVLPGADGRPGSEIPVGLAVLGTDPLSVVLGSPQVTVDWFVVHADHRRRGAEAALLAAAAAHAAETGADHVVAAVGGHEAEWRCRPPAGWPAASPAPAAPRSVGGRGLTRTWCGSELRVRSRCGPVGSGRSAGRWRWAGRRRR